MLRATTPPGGALAQEQDPLAEDLTLSFEPRTIEHLGLQMYSQLPAALAELIANAYDADANNVTVTVANDEQGSQFIAVHDDGHGMSRRDLNQKYLRIGRNRRESDGMHSESGRRKVSGKKGIGKLALFGIGRRIHVNTSRAGSPISTETILDWDDMLASGGSDYKPKTQDVKVAESSRGTQIEIHSLLRKTRIVPEELARSLARLFNYEGTFNLFLNWEEAQLQITPDLRHDEDDIQFRWDLPEDLPVALKDTAEYFSNNNVRGSVIGTKRTQKQDNRGVIVYINGRRANAAGFYGANESSYAFSYLSGILQADYLDELPVDVIASDRASINWELPATEELRSHIEQALSWVARDWRRKRGEEKQKKVIRRTQRDFEAWTENQRGEDGNNLRSLLSLLTSADVDMADETVDQVLEDLESLVPEYARLHWRHLHPAVREAAQEDYAREDYLRAVDEAMKAYSAAVRVKSGTEKSSDADIMNSAFGGASAMIDVARHFEMAAGTDVLSADTLKNIREGQHWFSRGLIAGFRNLSAHNQKQLLRRIEILTDRDCLDMLSLVSHLWFRLDGGALAVNDAPLA